MTCSWRGALLGDLDAQRARLVGHELHGAHHRAPLVVDGVVVAAEHLEQLVRADARRRSRARNSRSCACNSGCRRRIERSLTSMRAPDETPLAPGVTLESALSVDGGALGRF